MASCGDANLGVGRAMTSFAALLRGVNVGGKNLVSMTELATSFRELGYSNVRTHGNSGNVLFETGDGGTSSLEGTIEAKLRERFDVPIVVVLRSAQELDAIVTAAPADFGSDLLRSDVYFLKHPLTSEAAFAALPELRAGIDSMTAGPGVLYFSRVAALATKTRVQRVMAMPMFQQMTVRTWSVTTRLRDLLG